MLIHGLPAVSALYINIISNSVDNLYYNYIYFIYRATLRNLYMSSKIDRGITYTNVYYGTGMAGKLN